MRHHRFHNPVRRNRGFILAVSMVLLFIAVTGALLAARAVMERRRLDTRKHEVAKAFYIAEGGAGQVVHWAVHPEDYPQAPDLFKADDKGVLAGLKSALESQGEVMIADAALTSFTSEAGAPIGEIRRIRLLPREESDPDSTEFKIESVGRSPLGIERSVVYHVRKNELYTTGFPAALISEASAATGGNLRVHWGEVWAKGPIAMLNRSQMDHLRAGTMGHDPWAKYKTEGMINFPNNWRWGGGKDLFDPLRQQPGLSPASGEYADAFHQLQPAGHLAFPKYDYQTWKELARRIGNYYSTDPGGNLYRGGIEDAAHQVKNPLPEFSVRDRQSQPYDILFVDTTDGNPPAADGSNLTTLRFTGNSDGLKGIFYFAAHVDLTGVGNVPDLTATRPDGTEVVLSKVLLDGAMIVEGTVSMSGNAGVYGSVVTKRGFGGTGTADIYYNAELKTRPDAPPFASPILLGMFRNY